MNSAPRFSLREFTNNDINLMRLTVTPLAFLAGPKYFVYGPFVAVLFYALIWRSDVTRHLLSTQAWMRQMLFYVVPISYALGILMTLLYPDGAWIYAVAAIWFTSWLWHRCYKDYVKHHYKRPDAA